MPAPKKTPAAHFTRKSAPKPAVKSAPKPAPKSTLLTPAKLAKALDKVCAGLTNRASGQKGLLALSAACIAAGEHARITAQTGNLQQATLLLAHSVNGDHSTIMHNIGTVKTLLNSVAKSLRG